MLRIKFIIYLVFAKTAISTSQEIGLNSTTVPNTYEASSFLENDTALAKIEEILLTALNNYLADIDAHASKTLPENIPSEEIPTQNLEFPFFHIINDTDPVQSDFLASNITAMSEDQDSFSQIDSSLDDDYKTLSVGDVNSHYISSQNQTNTASSTEETPAIVLSPSPLSNNEKTVNDTTVDELLDRFTYINNTQSKNPMSNWHNSTMQNDSDILVQSDFSASNITEFSEPFPGYSYGQAQDKEPIQIEKLDEPELSDQNTEKATLNPFVDQSTQLANDNVSTESKPEENVSNELVTVVVANSTNTQAVRDTPVSNSPASSEETVVTVTPSYVYLDESKSSTTKEENITIVTPSSTAAEAQQKFYFPGNSFNNQMGISNIFGPYPTKPSQFLQNQFNNQNYPSSSVGTFISSNSINGQNPVTVITGNTVVNGEVQSQFVNVVDGQLSSNNLISGQKPTNNNPFANLFQNQFGSVTSQSSSSNVNNNQSYGNSVSSQMSVSSSSMAGKKPVVIISGSNYVNGQLQNQYYNITGGKIFGNNETDNINITAEEMINLSSTKTSFNEEIISNKNNSDLNKENVSLSSQILNPISSDDEKKSNNDVEKFSTITDQSDITTTIRTNLPITEFTDTSVITEIGDSTLSISEQESVASITQSNEETSFNVTNNDISAEVAEDKTALLNPSATVTTSSSIGKSLPDIEPSTLKTFKHHSKQPTLEHLPQMPVDQESTKSHTIHTRHHNIHNHKNHFGNWPYFIGSTNSHFEPSTFVTNDNLGHTTVTTTNPLLGQITSTTYGGGSHSYGDYNPDYRKYLFYKYYFSFPRHHYV